MNNRQVEDLLTLIAEQEMLGNNEVVTELCEVLDRLMGEAEGTA